MTIKDEKARLICIVKAQYHNCLSSASFAKADALASETQASKDVHLATAAAFEQVACWLKSIVDENKL